MHNNVSFGRYFGVHCFLLFSRIVILFCIVSVANAQDVDRALLRYYSIQLNEIPIVDRALVYRAENKEEASPEKMRLWKRDVLAEQNRLISVLPEGVYVTSRLYIVNNIVNVVSTIGGLAVPDIVRSAESLPIEPATESTTGVNTPYVPPADRDFVAVGFIDDGVDYIHTELGGSGANYEDNDPSFVESGTFPTGFIAGGVDLVGDNYSRAGNTLEELIPSRDADPMTNKLTHGTQVAKAIANFTKDSDWIPEGKAKIYAIKIRSQGSGDVYGSSFLEGVEWALDPNQDGDLSDHLDILSLSVGNSRLLTATALRKMTTYGVLLVSAAGNSGDTPYQLSSMSSIPASIAVAASLGHDSDLIPVRIGSSGAFNALLLPYDYERLDNISAAGILASTDECRIVEDVAGKVVFLNAQERNSRTQNICNQASIARQLNRLNALAFVVMGAENARFSGRFSPGEETLPVLVTDHFLAELDGDVTLLFEQRFSSENRRGLTSFSSRGPLNGVFKPELAAPGVNIYLPHAGGGDSLRPSGGTSFSAPYVAGIAAILKYHFPKESLNQIKSRLMNYAYPLYNREGDLESLARQGLGEVNIGLSVSADAFTIPAGINFGFFKIKDFEKVTKMIRVHNRSDTDRMYEISSLGGVFGDGVILRYPKSVWVPANSVENIPVELELDPFNLFARDTRFNLEFGELIQLTAPNAEPMNIGFQAVFEPLSSLSIATDVEMSHIYNESQYAIMASAFPVLNGLGSPSVNVPALGAYIIDKDGVDWLRLGAVFPNSWESSTEVIVIIRFLSNDISPTQAFRLLVRQTKAGLLNSQGQLLAEFDVRMRPNSQTMQLDIPLVGEGYDFSSFDMRFEWVRALRGLHFPVSIYRLQKNVASLPWVTDMPYRHEVGPFQLLSSPKALEGDSFWLIEGAESSIMAF